MEINSLRAMLSPGKRNPAADTALWNGQAETFARFEWPTTDNSFTMRVLARYGLPRSGDCVLDVGCGAGRYALALAKAGASVHGTDLSPNMIDSAEQSKKTYGLEQVTFSCEDFHACTADGWRERFDLVLANMTPAVQSADDLDRLNACSKRDVLLVKPTRRTDSVSDEVLNVLGTGKRSGAKNWIPAAFAYLWALGCSPELSYDQQCWHSERPLDKALEHYVNRARTQRELNASQEAAVRAYIRSIARDGLVREVVNSTVVAMYWKTPDPKQEG